MWEEYRWARIYKNQHPGLPDDFLHCHVSCQLVTKPGQSDWWAWFYGALNEFRQLPLHWLALVVYFYANLLRIRDYDVFNELIYRWNDTKSDVAANKAGRETGLAGHDCLCGCLKAYPPGSGS